MKEKIFKNIHTIILATLSIALIVTNITIIKTVTQINSLNKRINEQQTEIESLKNNKTNSNGIIIEFEIPKKSEKRTI